MTSSNSPARDFLKEYLAQNRRSLTGSQIRTLSVVIRSANREKMSIAYLAALMEMTLEMTLADEKPIRQIGAASAAYVLRVVRSSAQT